VKGDFGKAIEDDNEAIYLDPKDAWLSFNRGWMWSERNEKKKAEDDFAEVRRLDPGLGQALPTPENR
jgi:tetratricopeptide (TPR) repeat protein